LNSHQVSDLLKYILIPNPPPSLFDSGDSVLRREGEGILNADILKVFLDHGADPNFSVNKCSPWQGFLEYLNVSSNSHLTEFALSRQGLELDQQRTKALELLLLRGADPYFVYFRPKGLFSDQENVAIEQIIERPISSDKAQYLVDVLQRQRTKQKFNPSWLSWIWK
jgi:hypothetical protein